LCQRCYLMSPLLSSPSCDMLTVSEFFNFITPKTATRPFQLLHNLYVRISWQLQTQLNLYKHNTRQFLPYVTACTFESGVVLQKLAIFQLIYNCYASYENRILCKGMYENALLNFCCELYNFVIITFSKKKEPSLLPHNYYCKTHLNITLPLGYHLSRFVLNI
jgi:hypothetical protein